MLDCLDVLPRAARDSPLRLQYTASMAPNVRHVSAREGYDLWAGTYDATPNPVLQMDARHSLRILEPLAGELVLDAGCGTGRNLGAVLSAGARAVGVDVSGGMLRVARTSHPEARLALVDLQYGLPFADGTFDAVLCSLVGEHLPDLASSLSELRRVLKPAGRLVFSVYHPTLAAAGVEANFALDGSEYRLGCIPYSVQEYLDLVADAGFESIAFAEYRGDQRLADQLVEAQKYVGAQLLLLIAATV